jgi:hypothetical protein
VIPHQHSTQLQGLSQSRIVLQSLNMSRRFRNGAQERPNLLLEDKLGRMDRPGPLSVLRGVNVAAAGAVVKHFSC